MSIVVLVLLACGSKDEGGGGDDGGGDDSDSPVVDDSAPPIDADGDGVTEAEDCDDNDPYVFPGAKEDCNEKDDDCDNEIDEGVLVTSYGDEDRDGYGDDAAEEQGCWVPEGNAEVGGDCDDHNDAVNPGADEVCDKLDNDCDKLVDDDDVLDEGDDWYLDEDGDGYGGDKGILTCHDPGEGYDNVSTDCDDTDDHVYPGAIEVCGDGVVQDCIRSAGDSFAACNGDSVRASMADVRITLGSEQTIAFSDLTGDGTTDVVLGATIDSLSNGAYVFAGPVAGDLDAGDALALLGPGAKNAVVNVATGMYDGDAQADLLVGTPAESSDGRSGGAVYVELGPVTTGDLADADLVVVGDEPNGRIGSSVQSVWDSTGDGVGELLVGAGGADGDFEEEGVVWILEGGTSGTATAADLAVAEIHGRSSAQRFGAGTTAGDITGDGVQDIVVGNGEHIEQVAYVFAGPVSGTMTCDDADVFVNGAATDFGFGLSPLVVDLDGDGAEDLIVSAYDSSSGAEDGGRVLGWSGPLSSKSVVDDSDAMLDIEGFASGDYLGGSVQATDIDGDAVLDLVVQSGVDWTVGSSGSSADASRAGWVFFGPVDGTLDSTSSDIEINDSSGDRFAVAAPDVDGDGRIELAWDTDSAITHFVNLDGY